MSYFHREQSFQFCVIISLRANRQSGFKRQETNTRWSKLPPVLPETQQEVNANNNANRGIYTCRMQEFNVITNYKYKTDLN